LLDAALPILIKISSHLCHQCTKFSPKSLPACPQQLPMTFRFLFPKALPCLYHHNQRYIFSFLRKIMNELSLITPPNPLIILPFTFLIIFLSVSDQVNKKTVLFVGAVTTPDGVGVQRNAENYCVGLFPPGMYAHINSYGMATNLFYDLSNDTLSSWVHTQSKDINDSPRQRRLSYEASYGFFKPSSPQIAIYCSLFQIIILFSFLKVIQKLLTSSSSSFHPFLSIFLRVPSTRCFKGQLLGKVGTIQFTFLCVILRSMLSTPVTLCITFSFLARSVQLISSTLLQYHISKPSRCCCSTYIFFLVFPSLLSFPLPSVQ
jgi:hypothetical protein